jgi:hypothetical protein
MIAKPSIAKNRKGYPVNLDAVQFWKKQERIERARHQRPSVRRHITRRVKMPL